MLSEWGREDGEVHGCVSGDTSKVVAIECYSSGGTSIPCLLYLTFFFLALRFILKATPGIILVIQGIIPVV